jgi:hypothetical protein
MTVPWNNRPITMVFKYLKTVKSDTELSIGAMQTMSVSLQTPK